MAVGDKTIKFLRIELPTNILENFNSIVLSHLDYCALSNIGISSIMQKILLICQKNLELKKKKDKILDVIVSSRTDKTLRELKQEVVEIRGEAKLIGNQLKAIKSAIEIKSVQPPDNCIISLDL